MKRVSLTHRITKIGGKAVSVAVCALTGLVLFGAAGSAFATPVVYFQTIAAGRSYFDSTVATYANGGTSDLLTTTVSGLAGGNSWSVGGIGISATNGVSRSINDSYLSGAPSLNGTPTGQGINMTASGSDPVGSGLTFHFTSTLNAFGVEMGDWGTCCYPSALYIQFGLNGAWSAAQQIGVANSRTDVPEDNGQTFTFIGAVNDTNFFNDVRIYGAGNGDVLYAGGVLRTASVALNSVPSTSGSSTQAPSATDIDTGQASYLASNLGTSVNPAFVGGTLQIDSAGATIGSDFTVSNAGGTIDANGNNSTFSGVISDAASSTGSMTFTGSGTTALTNVNTYTGSTTINSGATLALSGSGSIAASSGVIDNGVFDISGTTSGATIKTLSGNGAVFLGARTLTLSNAAGTFGGVVSGSGGLSVTGGSETLTGANTYTGSTTINFGATLALSGSGSIAASSGVIDNGVFDISSTISGATIKTLSGNGAVVLGTRTLTLSNAAGTFGGVVDGSGGLSVTGGSETLTGANTYTGATSVGSGATLTLSGPGSLASGTINIASGGTFNDSNGGLSASANVTDNGTLSLGANEAINQLEGSGAVGLGSHTLTLNQGSFGGVISGTGGLVKAGDGTLTLSGINTYSGGTSVTGGVVAVSSDANLGDAAGPLALSDGTLRVINSFTTTRATSLTGTGTFVTDLGTALQDTGAVSGTGALFKDGVGTLQLCGDVSNSGGANVVAGRLDLCGNYTAPGAVSIASGATLGVTGTTSLASSSGITNDGTLDISGTTSSLGSTITALTGGGEVVLGNRNLNLSNASGSFGGVISGTGGVAVTGGSQTFSGTNTYTGATTIDSGAMLALTGAGTVGVASTLVNNGSFDVSGSAAGASIATVVGSGNVILGSQSLTLSNASGSFDGVISGAGGLNVTSGVVALGGVSTYTGGTTIGNGATVRVSSDANLGGAGGVLNLNGGTLQSTSSFSTARDINVTGTGTLQANNGTTLSSSGVVSGSGTLVKNGAGAVILSGDLAHTGGTVVNQGSLQLAGTNSYTGGTTLNGGTLKVASDASLGAGSSAITFNGGTLQATTSFSSARDVNATGGGTVATDSGATLSLTGSLVGAGQLTKTGAGTLVLSGDSSGDHSVGSGWTGGMTVNGGLVQVTNPWGLGWGNVTVNGGTVNTTVDILTGQSIVLAGNTTVNVDTGTTTTLSGTITDTGGDSGGGSGCFVKSGLGTLNLTGVMTQSNGTCVQQGELRANGTLDSVVAVDSPAILRGTGLINGPISVHGILAPGNSPGTLTTTSTVTMFAGSTFQADINGLGTASGPGNYSRLLVTGAGNQFVAGGATLAPNLTAITGAVTYTPYVPQLGDNFRIITADGGISGRFAPLAQPDGMATGTRMAVFYDVFGSNSVDLRVIPTSYASGLQAVNGNARALGAAVDRIVTADQQGASTTAQGQLFYTLAGLNAAQLPGVMTALSGEVHAALAAAAPRAGQWTQGAIGRQLGSGSGRNAADSTDLRDQRALWIEMGANRGQWSSDGTSSGFRTDRTQFAIGGDVASTANARLGVGFSHASSNLAMSGVSASGSMDENLFFGYGQYRMGGYAIDGMLGYGSSTWESTRVDPIAGAGSLKTHQRGENWLAGLAVRKPVELLTTVVEPFVRTLFQQTTRGDVSEGSASTAALSLDKYSANGFRAMVGVAAGSIRKDPLSAPYTYQAEIGVGQDSGNAVRPTLRASLAGESFTVAGPQVGRSFGQIGVSGTLRLAPQAFAYIGLTGEARSGQSDIGGNLGVRVAF